VGCFEIGDLFVHARDRQSILQKDNVRILGKCDLMALSVTLANMSHGEVPAQVSSKAIPASILAQADLAIVPNRRVSVRCFSGARYL
jgi:hypothetical protein